MYAPSKFSDGKVIFPGKTIGSEASWTAIVDTPTQPIFVALGSFQLAYQDPNWDWKTFDIDRDVKFVDEKTGFINAIDPDLSKFKARGGKILMYHGWNDVAISPQNSIDYYSSVLAKMGAQPGRLHPSLHGTWAWRTVRADRAPIRSTTWARSNAGAKAVSLRRR